MGRLNLARSLGLIALIGVAFAALRDPGQDWVSIWIAISGGLFALVTAHLIRKRGRDAASIGFVAGGGSYFVAAVLLLGAIGPMPGTTSMIDKVASLLDPPEPKRDPDFDLPRREILELSFERQEDLSSRYTNYYQSNSNHKRLVIARHETTARIGHSLLSLVGGSLCGGIVDLGARLWRRRFPTRDSSTAAHPPSE